MRLFTIDGFLSGGARQLPTIADAIAVGIHSSSEVDAANVNSVRLSVMSLVPLNGGSGITITPFRTPLNPLVVSWRNPADNNTTPGEKLVIVVYEACDKLVAPGPRAPYEFGVAVKAMPIAAGAAALVARIPFSGRRQLSLFVTPNANDATVLLRGIRYTLASAGNASLSISTEAPVVVVAANQVSANGDGIVLGRELIAGGGSDLQEGFDEIQIFAWQVAGSNSCVFSGSVFGERVL
jgi:hypothetical protein